MKLVIVESPTKARTLKKFLGKEYTIEASMGHVRDLPKSKLGVDVEHNFEPEYEVMKGKGTTVTKLKRLASEADEVILAMDPDREGEAIAYHMKFLIEESKKAKGKPFARVTFHEITKAAILEAMEESHTINSDLVDAQQARRVLDRLVGYSLSPILWKKVRRGLSAGRVQSVALRMLVEREAEIEAFEPQEYWQAQVKLDTQEAGKQTKKFEELTPTQFVAEVVEIDNKRLVVRGSDRDRGKTVCYVETEAVATQLRTDLETARYTILEIQKKERKRKPWAPFTTSTLQQAAANRLGWSGKQTMRIAQQLYEAGMITYHRTDSLNLSASAIEATRSLIEKEYGKQYLPSKGVAYKTRAKSAQEAHEAIRPTDVTKVAVTGVSGAVTARHEKLYQLIRKRLLACQMKPAVFDQTAIQIRGTGKATYMLKTTGSRMTFDGWMVVYPERQREASTVPELQEKQDVYAKGLLVEQKFTQPPPRYNDASLVKELEKRGIGRPSTYASIISVLVDRGYVERIEKRFHPTEVGKTVVGFLSDHFDAVMDYDFTAQMEADLDVIAEGKKEWRSVIGSFWKPFEKKLADAQDAERVSIPVEKTGAACPTCSEGELVVRSGRYGKFLSCSRFPECKHTAPLVQKLDDYPCPTCGADIVQKRTRKGRTFWGCSAYPNCDWASWNDPRGEQGDGGKDRV